MPPCPSRSLQQIVPDWEKERIVIAWPTVRGQYVAPCRNIVPFFHHLLELLIDCAIPVAVLVPSQRDAQSLTQTYDPPKGLWIEYVPGLSDIWLKDSAPWLIRVGSERILWQPEFDPAYLDAEPHIKSMRAVLESFFRRKVTEFGCTRLETATDWIWDGGNATCNGSGVIIATDQVLVDNRASGDRFESVCRSLGARSIVIPAEPGDDLAHSDGTIRFWSEDVVLINDFKNIPGISSSWRRKLNHYQDEVVGVLLDAGFRMSNILWIPCGPYADRAGFDGIPSARGCYINYLRLRDVVIVPTFGHSEQDQRALQFFAEILPQGVKLMNIESGLLADFGGILNCIAATY